MKGPDRPIPIRSGQLTHWPSEFCPKHLQRQVRFFTRARVRLDESFMVKSLDDEFTSEDQSRLKRKANWMAKLQAELLHHENWDGTPRV